MAAEAAAEKKATDILVIDVAELLVVTDYFVICTGNTDRQVRTIADEVEEQVRVRCGLKPIGREGADEGKWILIDFVDVVLHVFQPNEREFYRLDKLWSDAPRMKLPESITGPVKPKAEPMAVVDDEPEPVGDAAAAGDDREL